MLCRYQQPYEVFLFEDNSDDERISIRALVGSSLPIKVRVARNGIEAAQALGIDDQPPEAHSPIPALIIADLKFATINGDVILARARATKRLSSVPYVMFSSSDEPRDRARCMDLGASDYFAKPIDYTEYMDCLKGMLDRWLGPNCTKAVAEFHSSTAMLKSA